MEHRGREEPYIGGRVEVSLWVELELSDALELFERRVGEERVVGGGDGFVLDRGVHLDLPHVGVPTLKTTKRQARQGSTRINVDAPFSVLYCCWKQILRQLRRNSFTTKRKNPILCTMKICSVQFKNYNNFQ